MSAYVAVGQSTASVVSNMQREQVVVRIHVGANGYIQNAGYVLSPLAALEKGPIVGPKAIVLHRTDSTTAAGTLQSFQRGVGTHFLVDKDGTVTQAASLLKRTAHVGKIRSRCFDEGNCPAPEARAIKSWGFAPSRLYNHEKVKHYPARYPMNEESVGIETVAKFNATTQVWDPATSGQLAAIAKLVGILKDEYGISDADIYEHDKISYKEPGEGAGLFDGDDDGGLPSRFPPPFF